MTHKVHPATHIRSVGGCRRRPSFLRPENMTTMTRLSTAEEYLTSRSRCKFSTYSLMQTCGEVESGAFHPSHHVSQSMPACARCLLAAFYASWKCTSISLTYVASALQVGPIVPMSQIGANVGQILRSKTPPIHKDTRHPWGSYLNSNVYPERPNSK